MSKAAHTPGPWAVEDPMGPNEYAIVQDGLQPYEWQFIAVVEVGIPSEGLMPRQEARANARLIAAAPEMLVALQDLTRDDDPFDDFLEALARARSVIAKATGGAVK